MKREEVLLLFPDATEEQIKSLMDLNGKDINSTKSKYTTDQAELIRLKTIEGELETLRGSTMTSEQKYQKALDDMKVQAQKSAFDLNKMKAENILVSGGIKTDEIGDLLDGIVSEDFERTSKLANGVVTLLKSKIEATEKALKTQLLNNTPTPNGGTGDKSFDYNKKIEEAQASGNISEATYLIRLQAQSQPQ